MKKKTKEQLDKLRKKNKFSVICSGCANRTTWPLSPMWPFRRGCCPHCRSPLKPPALVKTYWAMQVEKLLHPERFRTQSTKKPSKKWVDYADYMRSPEWQKKKVAKKRQAGHACERCGSDKHLNVHHKTYERLGQERLSDLEVLCRNCHQGVHEVDLQARRHLDAIARSDEA